MKIAILDRGATKDLTIVMIAAQPNPHTEKSLMIARENIFPIVRLIRTTKH